MPLSHLLNEKEIHLFAGFASLKDSVFTED